MTQNPTPAERAQRVVLRHKGRDYPMTRAGYGRLLDRVAAKLKGDTKVDAAAEALMAKAGWAAPPTTAQAPLTPEQALVARAGWAD